MYISTFASFITLVQEGTSIMDEFYEEKAEKARQLYWDACKYPRKKKKKIRKIAKLDYQFYTSLKSQI